MDDDALLASIARKLFNPQSELYLDIRDYGIVIDGTLATLTEEETAAVSELLWPEAPRG